MANTADSEEKKNEKPKSTKMVKIRLPLTRELRDDVFAAVNGKTYLIKRGVDVMVPASVAAILENRERMLAVAMEAEAIAAQPLAALENIK